MNYGSPTGFTFQHASKESFSDLLQGKSSIDNIYKRQDVYMMYVESLDSAISQLYKLELGYDDSIHCYTASNGVTKKNNILLFKSYAEWKGKHVTSTTYTTFYSEKNSADMKLWTGYLDSINVSYEVIAKNQTREVGSGSGIKGPTTLGYTTYEVKITEDESEEENGG
jgi:hypothetical protein